MARKGLLGNIAHQNHCPESCWLHPHRGIAAMHRPLLASVLLVSVRGLVVTPAASRVLAPPLAVLSGHPYALHMTAALEPPTEPAVAASATPVASATDAFATDAFATENLSDADDPTRTTLELLEWPRLSAQVASLASTRAAKSLLEDGLPVNYTREESEVLQQETEEAFTLEQILVRPIELRGFSDIAPLVTHATKGGELDGESLVAIGESLVAAAGLLKVLRSTASDATKGTDTLQREDSISVLPSLFDGIPEQAALRRAISEAIDEAGKVRDSADPALGDLRFARREVATAARRELGRLIQLKSEALASTAASIRDDRFVLQVQAKQKHRVPGTVRDVSASGATLFIEPKQIEPTNTKLRQLAKREVRVGRTRCGPPGYLPAISRRSPRYLLKPKHH